MEEKRTMKEVLQHAVEHEITELNFLSKFAYPNEWTRERRLTLEEVQQLAAALSSKPLNAVVTTLNFGGSLDDAKMLPVARMLEVNQTLANLAVYGTHRLTAKGWAQLQKSLQRSPAPLKRVIIGSFIIDDATCAALLETLTRFATLRHVILFAVGPKTAAVLAKVLQTSNPPLDSLSLPGSLCITSGVKDAPPLSHLHLMCIMTSSNPAVSSVFVTGLEPLALKRLDVSSYRFDADASLAFVNYVSHSQTLQTLEAWLTDFDNAVDVWKRILLANDTLMAVNMSSACGGPSGFVQIWRSLENRGGQLTLEVDYPWDMNSAAVACVEQHNWPHVHLRVNRMSWTEFLQKHRDDLGIDAKDPAPSATLTNTGSTAGCPPSTPVLLPVLTASSTSTPTRALSGEEEERMRLGMEENGEMLRHQLADSARQALAQLTSAADSADSYAAVANHVHLLQNLSALDQWAAEQAAVELPQGADLITGHSVWPSHAHGMLRLRFFHNELCLQLSDFFLKAIGVSRKIGVERPKDLLDHAVSGVSFALSFIPVVGSLVSAVVSGVANAVRAKRFRNAQRRFANAVDSSMVTAAQIVDACAARIAHDYQEWLVCLSQKDIKRVATAATCRILMALKNHELACQRKQYATAHEMGTFLAALLHDNNQLHPDVMASLSAHGPEWAALHDPELSFLQRASAGSTSVFSASFRASDLFRHGHVLKAYTLERTVYIAATGGQAQPTQPSGEHLTVLQGDAPFPVRYVTPQEAEVLQHGSTVWQPLGVVSADEIAAPSSTPSAGSQSTPFPSGRRHKWMHLPEELQKMTLHSVRVLAADMARTSRETAETACVQPNNLRALAQAVRFQRAQSDVYNDTLQRIVQLHSQAQQGHALSLSDYNKQKSKEQEPLAAAKGKHNNKKNKNKNKNKNKKEKKSKKNEKHPSKSQHGASLGGAQEHKNEVPPGATATTDVEHKDSVLADSGVVVQRLEQCLRIAASRLQQLEHQQLANTQLMLQGDQQVDAPPVSANNDPDNAVEVHPDGTCTWREDLWQQQQLAKYEEEEEEVWSAQPKSSRWQDMDLYVGAAFSISGGLLGVEPVQDWLKAEVAKPVQDWVMKAAKPAKAWVKGAASTVKNKLGV